MNSRSRPISKLSRISIRASKTGSKFLRFAVPVLLLALSSAPAANDTPDTLRLEEPVPSETRSANTERAVRLMHLGDYRTAAALLESQLAESPADAGLRNMLATCYEQSKEYGKLILLRERQLASEPPDFHAFKDYGRAQLLFGNLDSARVSFFKALEYSGGSESNLQIIAEQYHTFGQYRPAEEFIDSARTYYGEARLLSARMGDALAAQQKFGRAALEYLTFAEKDSVSAKIGEEKIIALIRFPESADTVMAVLAERIDRQAPNSAMLSIYGQALMERDRYDDAFAFYRRQDSLQNKTGGEIIHFIRECMRRRKYDYIITAGEYMLAAHPESGLKNIAYFEMADAHTRLGQYEPALAKYNLILEDTRRSADVYEAHIQVGLLYKERLHDLNRAKEHFNIVLQRFPGSRFGRDAALALADVFVIEGSFDSAAVYYENQLEQELPEDLAEAIEFALAEIFLYKGNFTEAVNRFRRLINTYPRGLYVNNSIQYALIIGESAEQYPKQMDLFSSAEYYRHVGRDDSLEYYLTKICRVGIPGLAPLSYFHLAELHRRQNRFEESMAAIDSLAESYPRSYYMPLGLKLKADILWLEKDTRQAAVDLYRSLLERYGYYPFAAEIRDILRRETEADRI